MRLFLLSVSKARILPQFMNESDFVFSPNRFSDVLYRELHLSKIEYHQKSYFSCNSLQMNETEKKIIVLPH